MNNSVTWPFVEKREVVHGLLFTNYGKDITRRNRLNDLCVDCQYVRRPDNSLSPRDYVEQLVDSFDSKWSDATALDTLSRLVKAMEEDKGIKLTLYIDSATCPPRSGLSQSGRSPDVTPISGHEMPKEAKSPARDDVKREVPTTSAEEKPTEANTGSESGEQMRHRPTTSVYLSLLTAVVLAGLIAPLIFPTIPYYWWSLVFGLLGALFGALGVGGATSIVEIRNVKLNAWGAIGGLVVGALIPAIVALVNK